MAYPDYYREHLARGKKLEEAHEHSGTVLDVQLRQLEENGLGNLPLYRDIASMRGNLQALPFGHPAAVFVGLCRMLHGEGHLARPQVAHAQGQVCRGELRVVLFFARVKPQVLEQQDPPR